MNRTTITEIDTMPIIDPHRCLVLPLLAVLITPFAAVAGNTPPPVEEAKEEVEALGEEEKPDRGTRIFVAEPDGSQMRRLTEELDEFHFQGSPVWSQDGKLIAFDGWRPQRGEKLNQAKILLVNADGTQGRIVGDGAMPSFSPRAKRICFSRYYPNQGVWVMSTGGPDEELVLLDERGWGADWSPDGRMIAWARHDQGRANIVVLDLVEGERWQVFEEEESPYSAIRWNMTWSPNSTKIVFKGQRGKKFEVATVHARGAKHGSETLLEETVNESFAWRPDGKRILLAFHHPERKQRQIFFIDLEDGGSPKVLPAQDPDRNNGNMAYSPDGKQLLISSRP